MGDGKFIGAKHSKCFGGAKGLEGTVFVGVDDSWTGSGKSSGNGVIEAFVGFVGETSAVFV